MSSTHYETLGVARNATPDEIKQAYRREAGKAHPDREGGSGERMASVNRAYHCLSDPDRRATYDRTGNDNGGNSVGDEAVKMVLQLFADALTQDVDRDFVGFVRTTLTNRQASAKADLKRLSRAVVKIEKKRDRVRAKEGAPNLFQQLVDANVRRINEAIHNGESELQVFEAALALLDQHESNDPPGEPKKPVDFDPLSALFGWHIGAPG